MSHDRTIMRLFDAALNRSVEGVRVLEDTARMLFDDSELTGDCKRLRHDILKPVRAHSTFQKQLIDNRASDRDVLRSGETQSEKSRSDIASVIRANAGRVQEGLRSLEEFSKLVFPGHSAHYKQCRFVSYDLEKALLMKVHRSGRIAPERVRIVPILNVADAGVALHSVVSGCIETGVRCLVMDGEGLNDRAFIDAVRPVMETCREHSVSVLLVERADCAVVLAADGVMCGRDGLSMAEIGAVADESFLAWNLMESSDAATCIDDDSDLNLIVSSVGSLADRLSLVRMAKKGSSGLIVTEVDRKEVRHDLLLEFTDAGVDGFAFRVGSDVTALETLASCLGTILPADDEINGDADSPQREGASKSG